MVDERKVSVAYLLRLWRADHSRKDAAATIWHASLEQVDSGERIGFGNLDELFGFLNEEVKRRNRETANHERRVQDE